MRISVLVNKEGWLFSSKGQPEFPMGNFRPGQLYFAKYKRGCMGVNDNPHTPDVLGRNEFDPLPEDVPSGTEMAGG